MKRATQFLILLCLTLAALRCVATETNEAEWLPSISEPVRLEPAVLELIPIPGITNAPAIWIRNLDLDADGKEDSVLTVKIADELGPYWINYKAVTYVFRGDHTGAFGGYRTAFPWFYVVTYEGQMHVRYGDSQTRRLFSVSEQQGQWVVAVKQYEYGNSGGEAGDRLMTLRKTKATSVSLRELSNKGSHFIGTFRADK
jgi:hypothetical protein